MQPRIEDEQKKRTNERTNGRTGVALTVYIQRRRNMLTDWLRIYADTSRDIDDRPAQREVPLYVYDLGPALIYSRQLSTLPFDPNCIEMAGRPASPVKQSRPYSQPGRPSVRPSDRFWPNELASEGLATAPRTRAAAF